MNKEDEVGVVSGLMRFPVKSMSGESVEETKIGWQGFAGDRRFAFQRMDVSSGLPWLSGRDYPPILRYSSRWSGTPDREGHVDVERPDGRVVRVEDPALLAEISEATGWPLHLTQLWRSAVDSMPISLITTSTITAIAAAAGRELEPARFRPNIVIAPGMQREFIEDKWLGRLMVFGRRPDSARIRLNRKDPRCKIVSLDPATGAEDRRVLDAVVRMRKNMLGLYASTEFAGSIICGDVVRLVE